MNRKNDFILFLFIQLILTLISTINEGFLLLSIFIYFIVLIKEKYRSEIYLNAYYASLIYVLFHYLVFTLSYAEILPWETGIVVLLFILTLFYNIKINLLTNQLSFKQ